MNVTGDPARLAERAVLDADETIGLSAAALLYHCSPERMQQLAAAGEVPATKPGREWLFVRSVLLEHLAAQSRAEAEARRQQGTPAPAPDQPAPPRRGGRRTVPALPT